MATQSEAAGRTGSVWAGTGDLWLEGFVAFNFLCLTGDIALAHAENGFRNPAEYFPVYFSLAAFLMLLAGLVLRLRFQSVWAWKGAGNVAGWLSIAVGTAGVVYHLDSQFFYERTLKSLTYAAPFAAPLAYVGLGCLLVMNRMVRQGSKEWGEWVVFFTLGGFSGNFVLSLTDHATNGFYRMSEWIPVWSSALAVGFLAAILLQQVSGGFLWLCGGVLLLQVAVGGVGFLLHASADLHGLSGSLFENVIHGAPPFAPLLLPNLAILGMIGLVAIGNQKEGRSRNED